MEGIEILSMGQMKESPKWCEIAVAVLFILFAVSIIVTLISLAIDEIEIVLGGAICVGVFGILSVVVMMVGENIKEPTGRYRYEALIDKSVPIEYIYNNYDVIEKRDKIWVLEDKE